MPTEFIGISPMGLFCHFAKMDMGGPRRDFTESFDFPALFCSAGLRSIRVPVADRLAQNTIDLQWKIAAIYNARH
jgi:hypothetical protein